jgi:cytochrome P450
MTTLESTMSDSNIECPVGSVGADYEPFSAATTYQVLKRARDEEPVFYSPEINYWVITRREDILKVFRDPDRFSAQITLSPVTPFTDEVAELFKTEGFSAQPVQSNCDRPDHTRIREISSQILNARHYQSLEPEVRRIAGEFLAKLEGKPSVDLVHEIFYEFPAHVLFMILGIPDKDVAKIKRWADNRLLMTFGHLTATQQKKCAEDMVAYWKYCEALVADRLAKPRDDYPSHLVVARNGDDAVMTINEITSVVFGLLLAGHETTTNLSANALVSLLDQRDNWEAICKAPDLIPNAVEEALRFNTSVICWRRKALQDVEVGGKEIPAGANLLLALASANHDEKEFDHPERFDVHRANARRHISFGSGIHFCIGAPLARIELKVLLELLSSAYPDMRLSEQEFDIIETVSFRGPKQVWVDLNPTAPE